MVCYTSVLGTSQSPPLTRSSTSRRNQHLRCEFFSSIHASQLLAGGGLFCSNSTRNLREAKVRRTHGQVRERLLAEVHEQGGAHGATQRRHAEVVRREVRAHRLQHGVPQSHCGRALQQHLPLEVLQAVHGAGETEHGGSQSCRRVRREDGLRRKGHGVGRWGMGPRRASRTQPGAWTGGLAHVAGGELGILYVCDRL